MNWELLVGLPIMFFLVVVVVIRLLTPKKREEDHIDTHPPTHI